MGAKPTFTNSDGKGGGVGVANKEKKRWECLDQVISANSAFKCLLPPRSRNHGISEC